MKRTLASEIAELQQKYRGLTRVLETEACIELLGPLQFEASADGYEPITDEFEIKLIVPSSYPKELPWVRETGGRIKENYEHVFNNGKLCLAVPIEERLTFEQQPSLVGFVDKLLVPYLYGYCFWEKHGEHPFGEREHGEAGIVGFYVEKLGLSDDIQVLEVLLHLHQYGYRGHHDCPCGSGAKLRNCHGHALKKLYQLHTSETVRRDFCAVLKYCLQRDSEGELELPAALKRRTGNCLEKTAGNSR